MPIELLANREWLPGELLSGSEHQRPGWFLDMKYQTCFLGMEMYAQTVDTFSHVAWEQGYVYMLNVVVR